MRSAPTHAPHALTWLLASGLLLLLVWPARATELNHANLAELEQLKGIGPQLAQRLLEGRRQAGPFRDWDDLQRRVKGVGPVTARRLSEAGLRVAGRPAPGEEALTSGVPGPDAPQAAAASTPTR